MSPTPVRDETLGSLSDEPVGEKDPKAAKAISGKSPMRISLGRLMRDKVAVVCAFVVLLFILVAVFAGLIASFFGVDTDTVLASTVIDPLSGLPKEGPPNNGFDPDHPFGVAPRTGTDNLATWLFGARTSMAIAGVSTLIASVVGVIVGLTAGFVGGLVDKFLSFFIDFFLTIPFLLAALTLAPIINERFALNPSIYREVQFWGLIGILSLTGWMGIARLVRGEVLSLREREFVLAARVLGMPTRRILFRELLPNLAAPIVVSISLLLPAFVAAEAGLSFLGIGVQGSWGQTISLATDWFQIYPMYLWQPLLGVVLLVIALNLLGDAVRDALDPKTRR